MNKGIRNLALCLLVALVTFTLFYHSLQMSIPKPIYINYSDFIDYVKEGKVKEVEIVGRNIRGELRKGFAIIQNGKILKRDRQIFTTYIPYQDPNLLSLLKGNGVAFGGKEPTSPTWWSTFYPFLPMALILVIFWLFIFHQIKGHGIKTLSFGKSRAKLLSEEKPKVTFDDAAGIDEAKQELREVIEFLKDPKRFQKLGAKIPKGVLLVGPPGTGKTLLAKAVAGEADVPFFSISGSDFVEMFVGVGASRVRDLFEQGKKNAPCIIFVDEIDAVGRQRGAGLGGGHDEREQTLNQLLVEMDGFNTQEGVIIIAATNRPDVLDPALLRPGRFDRHIVVDTPDLIGREGILRVHTKDKPLSEEVDIKVIARRIPGFVGSDIANLVNEAALLAARRDKEKIEMAELEESIDRVIAGPERKSRIISEKEKSIVAYHESGHALVAKLLPDADPVHKISIMPRGVGALGYTLQLPIEDRYITTKSEILDKMTVLLGGRVAEELVFNDVTTGSKNDLEKATEIAHKMVCEYGMSENLGPLTFGRKEEQIFLGRDIVKERNYSEKVASAIDKEIRGIVEMSYNKARQLLEKNRKALDRLANRLKEKEVLEGEEIEKILKEENKVDMGEQNG
ncbi:MAG: ATP-dependent zinc metalloprotease FtsH [bacterium]|nr:ATP-dependent zinc metalloprotease FtsH [bacterium]